MIAAAEGVALHDAHAQRHLPVRAPVLQRVHGAALPAVERDALTRERRRDHPLVPDAPGQCDRVPEIGVRADAPEVGRAGPGAGVRRGPASVLGREVLALSVSAIPLPRTHTAVPGTSILKAASRPRLAQRVRTGESRVQWAKGGAKQPLSGYRPLATAEKFVFWTNAMTQASS
ncbi:hypothetical protein SPURM210S_06600 [Streptomyces purpurascens]